MSRWKRTQGLAWRLRCWHPEGCPASYALGLNALNEALQLSACRQLGEVPLCFSAAVSCLLPPAWGGHGVGMGMGKDPVMAWGWGLLVCIPPAALPVALNFGGNLFTVVVFFCCFFLNVVLKDHPDKPLEVEKGREEATQAPLELLVTSGCC